MVGKFTNLRYDKEAYDEEMSRSTNPLLYKLDPNYSVNCSSCLVKNPRQRDARTTGDKVDVDSVLKGINKVNSKVNRYQTPEPLNLSSAQMPSNCPDTIETQYSRYTHPSFDIRGLHVRDMRLGYPIHDPQCQIFENFEVNTRLQSKDNHRAIWQTPMDQKKMLPTERPGKLNCQVALNCNYAPYLP
jgi:hypothetical protein